jgi:phosphoenolpyruvate synthase/pyruvate phosphate dikinase
VASGLLAYGIDSLVVKSSKMSGHFQVQIGPFGVSTLIAPDTKEEWERIIDLPHGTPVTLNPTGISMGLYEGHLNIISAKPLTHSQDIIHLYRLAADECDWPVTHFKANIDAIKQAKKALELGSDGIGLIRTEHLALFDSLSRISVCEILMGSKEPSNFVNLKNRQQKQTEELFRAILEKREPSDPPYPVRIRLLDAPPEELLEQDQLEQLTHSFSEENMRGVQMALARKGLYENQLDAIFDAYEKMGEQKSAIGLEIMVPTVKTPEELLAVKRMALEAAQKHGINPSEFKFGIMLETIESAQNANLLAQHIDFIGIGSNDLTSAVLKISRTDIEALIIFRNAEPDHKDPFITLHDRVVAAIADAVSTYKSVNPNIDVSLCGVHGTDFDSLIKLTRAINLDAVSVPPSERNNLALQADFVLASNRLRQTPAQNANKPLSCGL